MLILIKRVQRKVAYQHNILLASLLKSIHPEVGAKEEGNDGNASIDIRSNKKDKTTSRRISLSNFIITAFRSINPFKK